jgi:hypothetical protein
MYLVCSYIENSYSTANDDTIATSGGANVYVRNYNICREFPVQTSLSAFYAFSWFLFPST